MHGKRKGQFFLLGAILLCAAFFAMLPSGLNTLASNERGLASLSDNLENEIPMALNLIILDDGNISRLGSFMDFIRKRVPARYASTEILWLVIEPSGTGSVDMYAGNWLGRHADITVSIDGDSATMSLDDREIAFRAFSVNGTAFNIQASFDGRMWSGEFPRDKTNLYAYVLLSRAEDIIVKDITA